MLKIDITQQLGELALSVNVTIAAKGVTAIFGRSGAGKSSLINLVAGLSKADNGSIILNDRILFDRQKRINQPPEQRKVGYVFQEPRLFPHYRVEGNLKYGCKRVAPQKFLQIVKLLGIEHLLQRFPNSLSGGEKQRVAIGRALLSDPDILLMDEPLSALDLPRKKELLDYLSQLAKQLEIPILYVSHSLDEVVRLADHLLLLEQGKVTAYADTATVWHSDAFSAWQPETQKMSLLELPIAELQPSYQMQGLAIREQRIWINQQSRYQIGEKLRITISSRDVSLALQKPQHTSIRNILQGRVCKIEMQSDRLDIAIQIEQQQIWASISLWAFEEMQLTEGQQVYVQIKSVSI